MPICAWKTPQLELAPTWAGPRERTLPPIGAPPRRVPHERRAALVTEGYSLHDPDFRSIQRGRPNGPKPRQREKSVSLSSGSHHPAVRLCPPVVQRRRLITGAALQPTRTASAARTPDLHTTRREIATRIVDPPTIQDGSERLHLWKEGATAAARTFAFLINLPERYGLWQIGFASLALMQPALQSTPVSADHGRAFCWIERRPHRVQQSRARHANAPQDGRVMPTSAKARDWNAVADVLDAAP